jgi:hypothetical protein
MGMGAVYYIFTPSSNGYLQDEELIKFTPVRRFAKYYWSEETAQAVSDQIPHDTEVVEFPL